jgi:hypothetical protein
LAVLVGLLIVATTSACDSTDSLDGMATATSTASPTATLVELPVRALDSLRDVDWATPEVIKHVLDDSGIVGEVDPERVIYADLTGDGIEEAVVVIGSGGAFADLGVAVYRLDDEGWARKVFLRKFIGAVEVREGTLVIREPVFARGEGVCCPSMVHETAYEWRERRFEQVSEETVPNP